MATYRFPRMLTLLAWESVLSPEPIAAGRPWSPPDGEDSLNLDFSAVEFADFGALARALLLLDAAVSCQKPASVTLPATLAGPASGRRGEPSLSADPNTGDGSSSAARRARSRADVLAFMRQVGFLDSLQPLHWAKGAVQIRDDAGTPDGTSESGLAPSRRGHDRDAPYRRRRVFPLRWLEPMPAERLRQSESFLAVAAGLEDLGLSRTDARTLSQTVLTELVENVAEHSRVGGRTPPTLIGALLLEAESYAAHQSGVHAQLAEIAERAVGDGSQVLRLIVADAGATLTSSLRTLGPPGGQPGTESATALADRPEKAVLSMLGRPLAQAQTGAQTQLSMGGLSWVGRVVRTYRGGILVRSADWRAGLIFGKSAEGTSVAETELNYAPGTLLELTLPTGRHPHRASSPWGSPSRTADVSRLHWLSCVFDLGQGLNDADRSRLTAQVHATLPQRNAAGLVVTISVQGAEQHPIDDRWRAAMNEVLEFVSSIARSAAVVLIFPDAEPHLLHPSIAAFNEQIAAARPARDHQQAGDAPAAPAPSPILVLGSHGDPVWCGGSAALRAILNRLSGQEGMLSIAEARNRWQAAEGALPQFMRSLRDHSHLISTGRQRLELRISTFSVHGAIERAVSQDLAAAINQGGTGVERGVFRGPTLRITSRWIDVERLLAATVGIQLAAFILAHKAEAALHATTPPGGATGIVQVGGASRSFIRYISECLMLAGSYYPQQSELDTNEPPIAERIPAGARVVLCTDLISTANTVQRAAANVIGGDAEPLIIVCVVDARDKPGPVRLLNRSIPVVSLIEIDISASGNTTGAGPAVTDIDPLLLRPEEEAAPASLAPVQETDLLRWCAADPDVLRLGHIDGLPHRHFSAFIRLHSLGRQQTRDRMTDVVLSTMEQALAEIGMPTAPRPAALAIWYIASDGNAERLAAAVKDRLIDQGTVVNAVPVLRLTAGDTWAFPDKLSIVSGPGLVVIVHWWALTGNTILQMVRLAAKSGARQIVAVCMLNQLDAQDAEVLHMLRAVCVPGDAAGPDLTPGQQAQPVPVAIRFVTVSSISGLDAHECPICATRGRYEIAADSVPRRLLRHAELLREILRPRDLDEVSRDAAADLFTVPVTSAEAVDYLRWRGLLLSALRRVPERQEVISALRALTAGPSGPKWSHNGLIRLLAAEQQWLRLPPLHLGMAKDLIVHVCVQSLEQRAAPPWLRVQALMVICAAAPQQLAELLQKLFLLVVDEAVLVDQLFLDCCHLLLHPPRESPVDVDQLRRNLMGCRDYLEERREVGDGTPADEHLHVVEELITIPDHRIFRRPKDAQAAWHRLREDLMRPVVRHRLETELLLVRSFVEDIEEVPPTPRSTVSAHAQWDTCSRQLEERALANLPALRDILAGDFVADWFGLPDQRRLLALARPDVRELRAVTERLRALMRGTWRPGDPGWQTLRREILDRINWWNRIFLATHIPDRHAPALLVDLVDSAPVRLSERVAAVLAWHQAQATITNPDQGHVLIFCPEKLLDQVLGHLLENVSKHRLPAATCRLRVDYAPAGPEAVQFTLRNSGTMPRRMSGKGLQALNDKLRPFGGSLTGQVLAEDAWTFAAVATLPLWYGG
jgi:adenine/guanine phosphoribosyltransferase-like PRPP-binding protein